MKPVVYACSKYPKYVGCPLSCAWRGSGVKVKADKEKGR